MSRASSCRKASPSANPSSVSELDGLAYCAASRLYKRYFHSYRLIHILNTFSKSFSETYAQGQYLHHGERKGKNQIYPYDNHRPLTW